VRPHIIEEKPTMRQLKQQPSAHNNIPFTFITDPTGTIYNACHHFTKREVFLLTIARQLDSVKLQEQYLQEFSELIDREELLKRRRFAAKKARSHSSMRRPHPAGYKQPSQILKDKRDAESSLPFSTKQMPVKLRRKRTLKTGTFTDDFTGPFQSTNLILPSRYSPYERRRGTRKDSPLRHSVFHSDYEDPDELLDDSELEFQQNDFINYRSPSSSPTLMDDMKDYDSADDSSHSSTTSYIDHSASNTTVPTFTRTDSLDLKNMTTVPAVMSVDELVNRGVTKQLPFQFLCYCAELEVLSLAAQQEETSTA